MADNGGDMILNIDYSDVPLAPSPSVKITGVRWRERNRLKREARRSDQPPKAQPQSGQDGRPAKRQRVEGEEEQPAYAKRVRQEGSRPAFDRSRERNRGDFSMSNEASPSKQNGVTSRLFTSNPTAVTDFTAKPTAVEDETPVQPSNAPLSDEAATFHALGLSRRISEHLSKNLGFKAPTAIQRNAITPLVNTDSDVFIQAETGSGKTLAYLLPLVQRIAALSQTEDGRRRQGVNIHRGSGLFAIVLAPTRELCTQIATGLDSLLRCTRWIVSTTVLGGERKHAEKARLRKGANILIATPGRLTDHLDNTEVLDVSRVRWLVLDEGDRLMEMGFEDDIRKIVDKIRASDLQSSKGSKTRDGVVLPAGVLPNRRVTVLCSATMQMNVQRLGEISLEDADHITSHSGKDAAGAVTTTLPTHPNGETQAESNGTGAPTVFSAPSQLKQSYIVAPAKLRLVTLLALLRSTFARKGTVMKAIIFMSCADSVDFHFDLLQSLPEDVKAAENKEKEKEREKKEKERVKENEKKSETSEDSDEDSEDDDDNDSDTDDEDEDEKKKKTQAKKKDDAVAKKSAKDFIAGTVAPATYITSAANRKIVLHKLHGSLAQPVRKATLESFRNEKNPCVLIATDIASRGLDVPAVELVIEYDPAFAVADHLHRMGRTARAGRPGKAVLFLQPGCEEGYITLLEGKPGGEEQAASSTGAATITPQSYETVLQKGFAAPIDLPSSSDTRDADHDPSRPNQSWAKRAEALQLHLEQRLVKGSNAGGGNAGGRNSGSSKKKGSQQQKGDQKWDQTNNKLLDEARQAFRSHVRAYTTHTRDERIYFDKLQLHLGHMAKSFGLRDAPAGMGGVVQRRGAKGQTASKSGAPAASSAAGSSGAPAPSRHNVDSDDEELGQVDQEAGRKMRAAIKAMMNAGASEFNIG